MHLTAFHFVMTFATKSQVLTGPRLAWEWVRFLVSEVITKTSAVAPDAEIYYGLSVAKQKRLPKTGPR